MHFGFLDLIFIIQGVSKRALQLWKRIEIYAEDIQGVSQKSWNIFFLKRFIDNTG